MGKFIWGRIVIILIHDLFSDILHEDGVRLNILGKRELLPPAVQQAARSAEDMTRHNDR
jgi:undecaprenyl pyrophosphate synthase